MLAERCADLDYVSIELTDDDGILRPLGDREITVTVSGAGTLLGFGSAQPITDQGFARDRHSTYWGRSLAVIRAGHSAGDVTITATADGCESVTLVVPVQAAYQSLSRG